MKVMIWIHTCVCVHGSVQHCLNCAQNEPYYHGVNKTIIYYLDIIFILIKLQLTVNIVLQNIFTLPINVGDVS